MRRPENVEALVRWQAVLVGVWSQLYVFSLFADESRRDAALIVATWLSAISTLCCGHAVTRATTRVVLFCALYALLCTILCVALFAVALFPSLRDAPGVAATHHSFLGTLVSALLVCVSVRTTVCVQNYGDAVCCCETTTSVAPNPSGRRTTKHAKRRKRRNKAEAASAARDDDTRRMTPAE